MRSDTEPTAAEDDAAADEAGTAPERYVIDLIPDELALARSQIASGLSLLAEGTVRRRIARLEAGGGPSVSDEIDAARLLLAEALWRQGRPIAARSTLDAIRASSPQRRLPIAMIIEAEALAAAGELDRSAGLVERVVRDIGADAAWELRAGTGSRATWPQPSVLEHRPEVPTHAPWEPAPGEDEPPDMARAALARGRVEAARVAYARDETGEGDRELSLALRLDPSCAVDALAILEPTLGNEPAPDRLLLYGDLLRATGREAEASTAYDRAISPPS